MSFDEGLKTGLVVVEPVTLKEVVAPEELMAFAYPEMKEVANSPP
jgi:hypothetical protein